MFAISLSSFVLSLLLSFVLTRLVRNHAVKHGWVSLPESDRHIHTAALPRIGGVAIYAALVVSLSLVLYYMSRHLVGQKFHMRTMAFLLVPGTLVFLLGLYDDIRGIGPYWKFSFETVAAVIVFAGGLRIVDLPLLFGSKQFGLAASLVATVFWILWITNAFNLIDGIDGLATGSALFSTFVVFIVSALNGNHFGLLLTATLSGALIGFLRFNFNPATIFLGDCGSLFVGFMLGSLALYGQKSPTMVAVAIPVVSFGLPILETVISVVRRFMNGKPLFEGDREHIHHKLLKRGLTARRRAGGAGSGRAGRHCLDRSSAPRLSRADRTAPRGPADPRSEAGHRQRSLRAPRDCRSCRLRQASSGPALAGEHVRQ